MKHVLCWIWVALLGGSVLTACDKLDDGEEEVLQGIIVGDWAFSYELDADIGVAFEFEEVIFRQDGTCSITYLEGTIDNGTTQTMLWRVRSFSERQVVAEYSFDVNGKSVTAVVVLDKII